jgi:hypothetical protein
MMSATPPDQTEATTNFARRMLPLGTGTARRSLKVSSTNSRPKTQLTISTNNINPAAAIISPNKLR